MKDITPLACLTVAIVEVVVSGIGPKGRFTWWLEVMPFLVAAPLLLASYRRFAFTPLVYWFMAFHVGVLALTAARDGAAGDDEVLQFSTPSGNIGCIYARFSDSPTELRCDIKSGLRPKPPKPKECDVDWGDSLAMHKEGRVYTVCHGDTALGGKPLAYGETWRHDGFTCTSRETGLTCKNLSGHGFFLSTKGSHRF